MKRWYAAAGRKILPIAVDDIEIPNIHSGQCIIKMILHAMLASPLLYDDIIPKH